MRGFSRQRLLYKKPHEAPIPHPCPLSQVKPQHSRADSSLHQTVSSALILDFPASRTVRNTFFSLQQHKEKELRLCSLLCSPSMTQYPIGATPRRKGSFWLLASENTVCWQGRQGGWGDQGGSIHHGASVGCSSIHLDWSGRRGTTSRPTHSHPCWLGHSPMTSQSGASSGHQVLKHMCLGPGETIHIQSVLLCTFLIYVMTGKAKDGGWWKLQEAWGPEHLLAGGWSERQGVDQNDHTLWTHEEEYAVILNLFTVGLNFFFKISAGKLYGLWRSRWMLLVKLTFPSAQSKLFYDSDKA